MGCKDKRVKENLQACIDALNTMGYDCAQVDDFRDKKSKVSILLQMMDRLYTRGAPNEGWLDDQLGAAELRRAKLKGDAEQAIILELLASAVLPRFSPGTGEAIDRAAKATRALEKERSLEVPALLDLCSGRGTYPAPPGLCALLSGDTVHRHREGRSSLSNNAKSIPTQCHTGPG